MLYKTFIIRIDESSGSGYPLHAISEDFGEARGWLSLEWASDELLQDVTDISDGKSSHELLVRLGANLYHVLFQGLIESIFQKSCSEADMAGGRGVRLQLRIEPPELRSYPWELLYSTLMHEFLCVQVNYPVVRYFELPVSSTPPYVQLPLNILIVIPRIPEGFANFDTGSEKRLLAEALKICGNNVTATYLESERGVTISDISDVLEHSEKQFHCFHFIGHGEFQNNLGYLLFNDRQGNADAVDERHFASLFRNQKQMRLVVLNSCKGAALSDTEPLAGMAPRLLSAGVPAVVAMHYAIYDDVAKLFAREFYRSLFMGANQGRVEYAISHARSRLEAEFPEERALATPVLYMHTKDGILFHSKSGNKWRDLYASTDAFNTGAIFQERLVEEKQRIQPLANSGDVVAGRELERLDTALNELKARIKFSRYVVISSTFVSLMFFLFAEIGLFDLMKWDTKAESMVMWLADQGGDQEFSEQLLIVPIIEESIRSLNKNSFDSSWRREHARLIHRLVDAKAKVIAFDLYFRKSSSFDDEFRNAVDYASQHGVDVIVGLRNMADIGLFSNIYPSLLNVNQVGTLCIGEKQGYANVLPLVSVKAENEKLFPSLALATYAAFLDKHIGLNPDPLEQELYLSSGDQAFIKKIPFYSLQTIDREHIQCGFITQGDRIAEFIIDLSPIKKIRSTSTRVPYHTLLNKMPDELRQIVESRIVLVGRESDTDWFTLFRGIKRQKRSGLELHADALHTLLKGIAIRPLGVMGDLLVMLSMSLMGALIAIKIPLNRSKARSIVLTVITGIYLTAAVNIFRSDKILLNMLYHLSAMFVSCYLTVKLKKMVTV